MADIEVALDLGSQYVTVASAKTGYTVKEPAVVAVDAADGKTIKAVGLAALKLSVDPTAKIKLSRPIAGGAITDRNGAKDLLKNLIGKVLPQNSLFSRAVVLCVTPCALPKSEKRKIELVLNMTNVKQTRFIAAPLAASAEIFKEFKVDKGVICDMGADKTDIAAVVLNEIVSGCTLYYGGRQMDKDVADFIHDKYGVQIPPEEAEKVKRKCAGLYPNDVSSTETQGINIRKGVIETVEITARELYDVAANIVSKYCQVIDSIFAGLPAETAKAIKNEGVFLCGGLSKINGVDKYFLDNLGVNARIPMSADTVNVRGALKLF